MRRVLRQTAQLIAPAYAVLWFSFVDPLHPAADPSVDLDSDLALAAWALAESGQTRGVTVMTMVLIVVLVARPGPSARRRTVEFAVLACVSLIALYGGKLANDHLVKPAIGVARPNIVELSERDLLGMDVHAFYELPEAERSEHLASISSGSGFGAITMSPEVRDHWVKETAFARPSGHSLAAMTLATYYVALAMTALAGWRRVLFVLLVPWATAVCLSRAVLRVHWPLDIVIGGFAGIVLGAAAYVTTCALLDRGESESIWLNPTASGRT